MAKEKGPAKTQQTISNFFVPRSSLVTASQAPKSPPSAATSSSANEHDSEGEGRTGRPLSLLANGARKRNVQEEEGHDDVEIRAVKRVRSDECNQKSSFFGGTISPKPSTKTPKALKSTPRTERYMYSSSQTTLAEGDEDWDDEASRARRHELHQKFVKKLGHPDSIAQIKRRNWAIVKDVEAPDEDGGEAEEEESPPPPKAKKKGAKTGKLTPMELQILDIKKKHMDTLLIVEVGYKFKFYGEDARIAAKELSIVCIPGKFRFDEHPSEAHLDRFASASIPVHRLPVHAKRLVAAGHKIGVVRQIETAALKKAGDNRNAPFIRKLTNVYTKGTYIDDIEALNQPGDVPTSGAPASGYLLCITESKAKGWGTDEKVDIGMLAVQPATGDVIYDNFGDEFMRAELETRLHHIAPCELLIVGDLTKATDKMIQHLSGSTMNLFGERIRVERVAKSKTMAAEAYSHVTQFYADKLKNQSHAESATEQNLLDKILNLEEPVTVCLSAMITHLTEYGLEHVFDLTKYFQSFITRSHMLLNGNTLTSLEIYQNQTDLTERGSLFWTLDKTQTKSGQRLLRKWVGRPLLDKARLEERVTAVEELSEGNQSPNVVKLRSLLRNIKPDVERSLIRIYYGKCTRPEVLTVLQTMQRIGYEYAFVTSPAGTGFTSTLINESIASLPRISDVVISFLQKMSAQAASKDDKYSFFREDAETESITDHKVGIAAVESELAAHRSVAATALKKRAPVPYVTVAAIEYLIEVPNTDLKNVPASWSKISGTKKLSRFHTPEVIRMLRERDQHKESLSAACDVAFKVFLSEISQHYALFRDTISHLSTLDCLLSLATVALLPGYTKPIFTSSTTIQITEGRHPMIEQLLPTTYIPNSISLSTPSASPSPSPSPSLPSSPSSSSSLLIPPQRPDPRALLLTGPNMGGKSSYVRSIALICILAQIGSFVPCNHARLGLLDGIYTRMGAHDALFAAQSTFQVELAETAAILRQATPRSLVILDELGRGTSTHDGTAIAEAVLHHVVAHTKALCLFVTHYQSLAGMQRGFTRGELRNMYMRFRAERRGQGEEVGAKGFVKNGEREPENGEEEITFLYEVGEGVAHRSYGLNVARLAKVPRSVLETAANKSNELEWKVKQKKLRGLSKIMTDVLGTEPSQLDVLVASIEQL